jgi:hypothetical protein
MLVIARSWPNFTARMRLLLEKIPSDTYTLVSPSHSLPLLFFFLPISKGERSAETALVVAPALVSVQVGFTNLDLNA